MTSDVTPTGLSLSGSDDTEPGTPERLADHRRNLGLLQTALPDPRFHHPDYLRWLYDENPVDPAIYACGDVRGQRMAHFAAIPQQYRGPGGTSPMVIAVNASTRAGGEGRGWFTRVAGSLYTRVATSGARGVIGVSNANSTPTLLKNLRHRLLGPLPVRVVPVGLARPTDHVEHLPVDRQLLAGDHLDALARSLDGSPSAGWVHDLSGDVLRWRLAAPGVASPYWIHLTDELMAVSARDGLPGVRVAVVLKLAPRVGTGPIVDPAPLIAAICGYHRSPLAIYAGFNRRVPVRGIRPPRGVQPSPLNLIYRSMDTSMPEESFRLDTFEFLDTDAY